MPPMQPAPPTFISSSRWSVTDLSGRILGLHSTSDRAPRSLTTRPVLGRTSVGCGGAAAGAAAACCAARCCCAREGLGVGEGC